MKKLSILLIFSVLFFNCKKEETSSCPDTTVNCSGVTCLLTNYYFDFRLVDINTSADLIFGATPRYDASDIKLFADAAKTVTISFTVDNANKLLKVQQAEPEMYLEVDATTTYKITVDFRKVDCCTYLVKNLTMNNQSVCVCCSDAVELKVN